MRYLLPKGKDTLHGKENFEKALPSKLET